MAEDITAAEIVQWFLDAGIKRRPIPTTEQVAPLVQIARTHMQLISTDLERLFPGITAAQQWARHMRSASPHLAKAKSILLQARSAIQLSGRLEAEYEAHEEEAGLITAALDTINPLLERFPPRQRGQRGRSAIMTEMMMLPWAQAVRDVLLSAGWANADISGDDAPIPIIVSRMAFRVFGEKVIPSTIARQVRRLRSNLNTTEPTTIPKAELQPNKRHGSKGRKHE